MLRPEYPLLTPRLELRPFVAADLDGLFAIQSRPEVARYLYWDARGLNDVRTSLERKIKESALDEEGQALSLAVVRRDTGQLAGEVNLFWINRTHGLGEVGYVFHPDHGGNGFATEAAEVVVGLGFDRLGLHRMIGRLDNRNAASARVLERLGMRREAHFVQNEFVKGEWADEVVYAILDNEWKARQVSQLP